MRTNRTPFFFFLIIIIIMWRIQMPSKMAFSAALCGNLLLRSSYGCFSSSSEPFCWRLNRSQRKLATVGTQNRKTHSLLVIKSVLDKRQPNISSSDNGATEPARVLLERLFAQTQKLEEQMNKDSSLSEGIQLSISLEVFESDLESALAALRKKEEDLEDAERMVLLDLSELNRAKRELEQREQDIAAASVEHNKLGEDLKKANNDLAFHARQIEDLKFLVEERDREIASAESTYSLKEVELDKLRNELVNKNKEASRLNSDLVARDQLLNEANGVIKKQEDKVQELERVVTEKESELAKSIRLRKVEAEKLKIAEANLQKQTVDWLSAQEELKKLTEVTSRHMSETNEMLEEFRRVRTLLSDVRSELISSQKYLAASRGKMEDQEHQLEKQLAELKEEKVIVMSYSSRLKDAQLEVESERNQLIDAKARSKELECQLFAEQELIEHLKQELNNEKSSLEQATQDIALLREELHQKTSEFNGAQNLLQVRESELAEARLQIQHLRSEWSSIQIIVEEKDMDLQSAQKKLEEVNKDVAELKRLMGSKEEQLIQATSKLKEKEEHVERVQHELHDTKMKFSEAATVVERISQLTNELVISVKDENSNPLHISVEDSPFFEVKCEPQQMLEKLMLNLRRQKELETELEMTREYLRKKEMEFLAAQRALAKKDEELKTVLNKWDTREKELKKTKEEMVEDANGTQKLYEIAQETIGDRSRGDIVIEKLQLKAARLEIEAATSALHHLAVMSQDLLKETKTCLSLDDDALILPKENAEMGYVLRASLAYRDKCLEMGQTEVARLSALAEQLVKEAGIASAADSR